MMTCGGHGGSIKQGGGKIGERGCALENTYFYREVNYVYYPYSVHIYSLFCWIEVMYSCTLTLN